MSRTLGCALATASVAHGAMTAFGIDAPGNHRHNARLIRAKSRVRRHRLPGQSSGHVILLNI